MSKIEELIDSIRQSTGGYYSGPDFYDYSIERIMEEYAEYYAEKFRQSLFEYAFEMNGVQVIEITTLKQEIKLPEHA